MASIHKTKHAWLQVLSPIVFILAGVGVTELPATAMPKIGSLSNNLYLAQVGVRSRVVPPTPLNLKPRYHIPLPQSNYHRRGYYGHDNYYDRDHHHHHKYGRRRSRSRRPIIIINPAVEQHRSTSQRYIRIIRR